MMLILYLLIHFVKININNIKKKFETLIQHNGVKRYLWECWNTKRRVKTCRLGAAPDKTGRYHC